MTRNFHDREIDQLLTRAHREGIGAEVYLQTLEQTTIQVEHGAVEHFGLARSRGIGVRVFENGRVGQAFTEDLGVSALDDVLDSARQNARLLGADPVVGLASNIGQPVSLELERPELALIPVRTKIDLAISLHDMARGLDSRIRQVTHTTFSDGHGAVRIASTEGVDRHQRSSAATLYTAPLVEEGGQRKTHYAVRSTRDWDKLDAESLAREAVEIAVAKLGATVPESGDYPVLLAREALSDLLGVYLKIFSAKVAQEGKSLLAGRVGEAIAGPRVTLIDDPHDLNGMGARSFDAEGTWTRPMTLVENGVFQGFLYGQESARRAGVESTGHAVRGGYRGGLDVGPSNLIWKPGTRDKAALLSELGKGILVTDLTGLHAGANAISGDFSLQAEGFLIEDGKVAGPLHGFTVAGNFYRLLQDVVESANDLDFQSGSIATPTVWIKSLAIAGS